MRPSGLAPLILLLGLPARAAAQAPTPPAALAPTAPAQDPEPPPAPPPPPDAPPVPPPASAPAPEAAPPIAPAPEPPSATRSEAAPGATAKVTPLTLRVPNKLPPFERAKWPLTIDLKLGMSWRPEGDAGFDAEDRIGTELGGSLYLDITDKIGAGLEVDRASLGRGNSINGFNSITVDYSDWSAM